MFPRPKGVEIKGDRRLDEPLFTSPVSLLWFMFLIRTEFFLLVLFVSLTITEMRTICRILFRNLRFVEGRE